MASFSTTSVALDTKHSLMKQIRSHEVAVDELNNLSSSRTVYQKNGDIFFRTSIPKAVANEQKQLDLLKDKLKILDST